MRGVEDEHLGSGGDGVFELGEVDGPVCGRGGADSAVRWWVQGHVSDGAAGDLDVGDVLVEEGLEDDDFVAFLDEGHKGAQHTFVCAGGYGHFGGGVEGPVEEGGVGVCYGFFQSWSALVRGGSVSMCFGWLYLRGLGAVYGCGRVLIAFDSTKSFFRGVDYVLGWVVTTIIDHQHFEHCANWKTRLLHTHKNPCPMLTMGCTGDLAAASLMIDLYEI